MSGDIFSREREFCLHFIKNNKADGLNISNSSVDLIVKYSNLNSWDSEKGRYEIDNLWKAYNLAFIGYKALCNVLKYRTCDAKFVTEYTFTMLKFNPENFHSREFKSVPY